MRAIRELITLLDVVLNWTQRLSKLFKIIFVFFATTDEDGSGLIAPTVQ
jgi:hypothetical protein